MPSQPAKSKPKASGRDAAKPADDKPEPRLEETSVEITADPKVLRTYKALSALKYTSTKNGKVRNAMPGDILDDLGDKDVTKFRGLKVIALQIEG